MRILFVHNSTDIYGASRSLVRLLRELDRSRFQPVALLPAEGELADWLRGLSVPVLIFPSLSVITREVFRSWRLLPFLLNIPLSAVRLARILRAEQIDLVHTNTGVILSPGPAAWLAGVPHLHHVRDSFLEFRNLWRPYEAWLRTFATRILAVSEAIAAQFGDRRKVRVLHNGFDLAEFPVETGARAAFREQHGIGAGEVVVGCVGRIKLRRKGQEVLIAAAALLNARGVRARYLVVGSPYRGNEGHLETLRQMVRDGDLGDDVLFTGELPDPKPAYAAMDIFVLPSAQPEPFGGVVMEAMAMGLPVIATAIGGSVEQVADGVTGFLVPPADPEALAARLELLLGDADRRGRFGSAGRERVRTHFALKDMVAKLTRHYEDCLPAR